MLLCGMGDAHLWSENGAQLLKMDLADLSNKVH
jgi:hypothetical protein